MATINATRRPDDELFAVWPDGWYAAIEEVHRGDYAHRSDDYAVVSLSDHETLHALGLDEPIDSTA